MLWLSYLIVQVYTCSAIQSVELDLSQQDLLIWLFGSLSLWINCSVVFFMFVCLFVCICWETVFSSRMSDSESISVCIYHICANLLLLYLLYGNTTNPLVS